MSLKKKKEFQKNGKQPDKIDDESRHTSEENERKEEWGKKHCSGIQMYFFFRCWLTCASQYNENALTIRPRRRTRSTYNNTCAWIVWKRGRNADNERITHEKYLFNTAVAATHTVAAVNTKYTYQHNVSIKTNKRTIKSTGYRAVFASTLLLDRFDQTSMYSIYYYYYATRHLHTRERAHRWHSTYEVEWEKSINETHTHIPKQRDDFEQCVEQLLPSDSVEP